MPKQFNLCFLLLLSLLLAMQTVNKAGEAARPATLKLPQRIVTLGDSITDGYTYQILLSQALQEAGYKPPVIINAGVASDTAAMMLARLERDVLVYKPELVIFMAGTNDVMRGVSTAQYEEQVAAIADKLNAARVRMVLLSPPIIGPKHPGKNEILAEYIQAIHRVAQKHDFAVAKVHENMRTAAEKENNLLSPDDIHLSFAGYCVMTRSVLDALGAHAVAVPVSANIPVLPGLVTQWQVRISPEDKPLEDVGALALIPDDTWKKLTLPQTKEEAGAGLDWWEDQERQRGFAYLKPLLGKAKRYQGFATLDSATERTVFFNTGALLQGVWLNGIRLYTNDTWTGWHAGKQRIPAKLKAGRNTIIIEANDVFSLNVTESNLW